jgi:hypothetical protein
VSVRLFHKDARIVLVISRREPGQETWWSPQRAPRDWGAVLQPALELLALRPDAASGGRVNCRLGSLDWTNHRYWSTISVRFDAGSPTKRKLVCAALLRAARYWLVSDSR